MNSRSLGLLLMVVGATAVVVGLAVFTGALSWFGRLPGDIRIETENTRIYVPITSMLLVSIVLSLIVSVLRRMF
jgi:uncharacterized protein HemY